MFEDYGNGVLTDEDMRSAMSMIRAAKKSVSEGKTDVAALKKQKAPKQELRTAMAANEEYEISEAVLNELEYFTTPAALARLAWARSVTEQGLAGVPKTSDEAVARAKALPADTPERRLIRREAIADAGLALRCKKAAAKYYPNGIVPFDEKGLNALYVEEKALEEKKAALLKEKADKTEVAAITAEIRANARKIKEKHEEYQRFMESAKVVREARKFLTQAENYSRFGELDSIFDTAAD